MKRLSISELNPHDVIIFDVETTGLDKDIDRIVSISAWKGGIRHDGQGVVLEGLYNPKISIPRSASNVHGITNRKVKNCPEIAEDLQQIVDFIGDRPIIAHNAKFDIGFLNAELDRNSFNTLRNPTVCTMIEMRKISGYGNASLDKALDYFDLQGRRARQHNATEDVILTARLAANIFNYYKPRHEENRSSTTGLSTVWGTTF